MRWPGLFDGVDSKLEDWIVDQMFIVSYSSSSLFFKSSNTILYRFF